MFDIAMHIYQKKQHENITPPLQGEGMIWLPAVQSSLLQAPNSFTEQQGEVSEQAVVFLGKALNGYTQGQCSL